MSKEFNVDKAVQDLADYFKAKMLKGEFRILKKSYSTYDIEIGNHLIKVMGTVFDEWIVLDELINKYLVLAGDEGVKFSSIIKSRNKVVMAIEKQKLANSIAELQRKHDEMM